jgi:fructosamine-3-kinase
LNQTIKDKIEYIFNLAVMNSKPVMGGSISNAYQIMLENNMCYFIKYKLNAPADMFNKEANGLKELAKANAIKIPSVIHSDSECIIQEVVATGQPVKNFYNVFGRKIAQLHKYKGEAFGFYEDNYIGTTVQVNTIQDLKDVNWTSFYFNNRLLYQYKLAESKKLVSSELRKAFQMLESKIEEILSGDNETPSLLHGDLWGQNFLITSEGLPCLIDPAVYYGSREAELAMTKLFGGFNPEFYYAYNEEYPLQPGYQYRENIYKLYHVLNHLNLFGPSYYAHAVNLINFYIR